MPKQIVISATGDPDASELTNCYFLPTNHHGRYILFDQNGRPILTDPIPVRSGENFTFHHNGFHWGVYNFSLNNENGGGSWTNTDTPPLPTIADYVEGGTFTAQATGGGVEEDEESASAATA